MRVRFINTDVLKPHKNYFVSCVICGLCVKLSCPLQKVSYHVIMVVLDCTFSVFLFCAWYTYGMMI